MIPILDSEPLCMYEVRYSNKIDWGKIRVIEYAPYMLEIRLPTRRLDGRYKKELTLNEVKGIFVKFYRGDKE